VQRTSDGGYAIAADSLAHFSDPDLLLVKTDSTGTTIWEQVYGGPEADRASAVVQTSDGGYLLTGYMGLDSSRAVVLRLDSLGSVLWVDSGPTGAATHDVDLTADGGYVVVGAQRLDSIYLRKLNSEGDAVWQKVLPGCRRRQWSFAKLTVQQTSDGGFVTASDLVFKTDSIGNLEWSRSYSDVSVLFSIQQTSDGGYVATGIGPDPSVPHHTQNLVLLRTDGQGSEVWRRLYRNGAPAGGRCVRQTYDGGFFVVGNSNGIFLVRTDSLGNEDWTWADPESLGQFARWGIQTPDGGFAVLTNRFLMKLAPEGQ
jgi:hypothetical protein